jgi:hypothetical protein
LNVPTENWATFAPGLLISFAHVTAPFVFNGPLLNSLKRIVLRAVPFSYKNRPPRLTNLYLRSS